MTTEFAECDEAMRHWNAAKEAETHIDPFMPPQYDYYRSLVQAEKQAAETSLKAHRMGKCSCVIRAAMAAVSGEVLSENG